MRILLVASLFSSMAFAQEGVWTGYVNGWVKTGPQQPVSLNNGGLIRTDRATRQQQAQLAQWYAWQQYAAGQYFMTQQVLAAEKARQEAEAVSRADEAALHLELAREQERAAAARAELDRQQAAAQQEQLRLQQQLLEQERERAEEARRALAVEEAQRALQREAERKLEEERETLRRALARVEEEAKPREPGPQIHKWVDEDGVTHFSTRPREMK